MTAVFAANSLLGVLRRPDFDRLLQKSMVFTHHICERLQHPELISYLQITRRADARARRGLGC